MKPEWKFLTDTFFEAAVFWVMITAVASIALVILGVIPLIRSKKTELAESLKKDFWVREARVIWFLVGYHLFRFDPVSGLFAVTAAGNDGLREQIRELLGERRFFTTAEVNNFLLNPLEQMAMFAHIKAIRIEDAYILFGDYVSVVVNDDAIATYILFVRERDGNPNAFNSLTRLYEELGRYEMKITGRRTGRFSNRQRVG
jgi:hypothetical protein